MAREIKEATWCDWHRLLPTPRKVEATLVRVNPAGKEIDVCEPCSMRWDLAIPHMDFFHPDVLEALFRTGNTPADEKPHRIPDQLAIIDKPTDTTPPNPQPTTKPDKTAKKTPTRRNGPRNLGRWEDDTPQVRCPLPHSSAKSVNEYWVAIPDRGSHAAGSHKLKPQEIPWVLPDDGSVTLPYKCTEHRVCAAHDHGAGYGFPTKGALSTHRSLAARSGWKLANTDTAKTSA